MSLETMHNRNQNAHSALEIKQHNQTKSSQEAQKDLWEAIKTVISLQNQAPPLVPISRNDNLPLSFSQERLWFLEQLESRRASAYNMPSAFRITGELDVVVLQQSLNEILRRHEALRTTFSSFEGKPIQVIHPELTLSLPIIKLQDISPDQRETKAMQLIKEEVQRPFDLNQLPLLRTTLLHLDEDEYVLLLTVHHIVVDFWSKGILFQELSALYEAFSTGKPSPLPQLPIQYADFAAWQRQWLQGEFLEVLLEYWQQQLGNNLCELQLPTDRERSTLQPRRSAHQKLVLPEELTKKLKTLSRQEGTTLFVTLLAAFKVLLHRYTEQEDIFLCSPIANRNRKEVKGLIGYFVNLLILRTDLSGNPTFRELLKRVRKITSGGYAYQDLPVQQLVKSLNLLQTPLSRVMFGLQNTAIQTFELPGLTVRSLDIDSGTADFDLYLYLLEEEGTLSAILKYNANLFDDTTIFQMLNHFQTVLENIIINPEQSILLLLPLDKAEQQQLINKKQGKSSSNQKRIYIAPRSPLELQLTQLWTQVLGIQSIGVKDNFFELGGESLLAMSLFAQIEKIFDKTLPLTTLLQAPTVEQLAKVLSQEVNSVCWSSLVPIQPSGTKPPLFCIHGQQGNVLNFRKLSQYLGSDQPLYGLQAKGLDGKELPYFHLVDIATHYIQEIRTLQPEGPYFLAGNSMGGTIAFEMAQQLYKQGQQVAFLMMFDTFGLDCFPRLSFRRQHYWTYLFQLGISKSLLNEVNELLQREVQEIISRLYLSLGRPLSRNLRNELVAEANMQAKRSYKAQTYPGCVTLLRASQPASFTKLYLPTSEDWYNRDTQHGWSEVVGGGLEIYDIPGDHFSIFEEPHVQVLAKKLRDCLDEAQTKYQKSIAKLATI
ncbi:condensation domain-containing protein [Pelatocladus sp. BLCC-F211]|uniref:condensation domain-containing protein n=1 Tax=Pelatocladus sp. BLCC-F211 TaxID=3342752 RepID=UPI0035B878AB